MSNFFLSRPLCAAIAFIVATSISDGFAADDFAAKQQRLKQLHEQRKQDFAKKRREAELRRRRQQAPQRQAQRTKPIANTISTGNSAPRPEVCLVEFLVAVKRARSMTAILKYLPQEKREAHLRKADRFDPKKAREQRVRLEKQGGWDKDLLDRMTTHPDKSKLTFYQGLVEKFHDLESVKVDGNRAKIVINTHGPEVKLVSGRRPRGYVDMILEGNYWRFAGFREDEIMFLK